MNLFQAITRRPAERSFSNSLLPFNAWAGQLATWGGTQTLVRDREEVGSDFCGYVDGIYKANGVVFACMAARALLFAEARFQWRQLRSGRPGDYFGTPELSLLENPWPNGTTGDLLARAIQDVDLAGNFYAVRQGDRLHRLHPEWVTIVLGSLRGDWRPGDPDTEVLGYVYEPGGPASGSAPQRFLVEQVVHWAPLKDPSASFRGMSWLTPIVREVLGDSAAMAHKLQFFEQGATPNLFVGLPEEVKRPQFMEWAEAFRQEYEGLDSAYKTMMLGGGADVKVIGADLKQVSFKETQGHGEPLAVDTPVPTPAGWTTMGDIEAGDYVFGREGLPVRVVGASPVHEGRPCFRVTFSDRTSIVADEGHLWRVIDRNSTGPGNVRTESTKTTRELLDGISEWQARGTRGNRYGVPAGRPCELPDVDLLVDPYVLGVWLGDGQTAGAAVCGAEPDLSFIAAEIERRGYTVRRWSVKPPKVPVIGLPGGLLAALDALGVLGNKHIPLEYLRSSLSQRLDLLRGLMDTDGSIGHVGNETCEFSSKWEHLARQVAELARSLGYRASVGEKKDSRSRTGSTWRVTFRADPDVVPFLLARKAERCQTPVWVKNRAVVSVCPVESVPVRCIAVDAEDHLFRAGDGWTLTHNTRICAAARVPPIIVGVSEGLESATYSNYGQARRAFGDMTLRPLWRTACSSFQTVLTVPPGSQLFYDDRDIPFLQEDQLDAAAVQTQQAQMIRTLIDGGFQPDVAVGAVMAGDLGRLKSGHTGLFSVQLQKPGGGSPDSPPEPPASGSANGGGRDLFAELAPLLN